jgi:hypothetical protein
MTGELYGGDNLIVNTVVIVKNRLGGFYVEEADNNTFIDNVVQDTTGLAGFYIGSWGGDTLVGNVALRNRVGFLIDTGARLMGNRAEDNGVGFQIEQALELTGNIAKRNAGAGFMLGRLTLHLASYNVAEGNGDDGFRIKFDNYKVLDDEDNRVDPSPVTIVNNYAISNRGKGLHVVPEEGEELSMPRTTIRGNTAIRNQGGDLADDTDCRWTLWQDNRFGTASPDCVQ